MKPLVSAFNAWTCITNSLFAIVILSVIGSMFAHGHHSMMGSDEDPADGGKVAAAVFGAVGVYGVSTALRCEMIVCMVEFGAGVVAGLVVGEGEVWGVHEMVMLILCCDCRSSSFSAAARRLFTGDRVGRVRLRCDERGAERWKTMDWMHERRLLRWVRETITCGVETPGSLGYIARRWRSCLYGLETSYDHLRPLRIWVTPFQQTLQSPSAARSTDAALNKAHPGIGDTDTLRSPYAAQSALVSGPPNAHTARSRDSTSNSASESHITTGACR